MRAITEAIPPGEVAPKSGRLVFVAVALGVPALLTVTRQDSTLTDRLVLAGIVLVLTTTASWRVSRALRAHARSEADLAHQATHDPLTTLPNRLAVEDHLRRVLLETRATDAQIALLFLDLDRFKLLNDTMGHSAGDELLVAVAGRLKGRVRRHELVARVGGDEFVVIIDDVVGVPEALEVCQRIRAALEAPFVLREGEVFTSTSIGVALSEGRAAGGAAEMIREADTAMYQAKDAGRNRVSVFDGSMRDRVAERLTLEHDLRFALERDELDVHFQPIIRLPAGPVGGLEALLRWSHPTRGPIPPSEIHPDRRGELAHRRDRQVGVGTHVPAARRMATERRRTRRLLRLGEPLGAPDAGSAAPRHGPSGPRGARAARERALPRAHRDPPHGGAGDGQFALDAPCARSGCSSRSTTSAPDTRRSPTCSDSPPRA